MNVASNNQLTEVLLSVDCAAAEKPVLEFENNQWGRGPSRNSVVVPARQATQPGGIGSLESILGLIKSLKIRALVFLNKTDHQKPRR